MGDREVIIDIIGDRDIIVKYVLNEVGNVCISEFAENMVSLYNKILTECVCVSVCAS